MTQADKQAVLLADIGGTNARFALLVDGAVTAVDRMRVADYPTVRAAIAAYLQKHGGGAAPRAAHLAVAGNVQNGRCVMTNSPWVIDAAELRAAFAIAHIEVINDFEAVAWSLTRIPAVSLRKVGGGEPLPTAPKFALGPGTGLGMAGNVPTSHGRRILASEGGHATLAGINAREDAVIGLLRDQFGHVSAERVLSGGGLENVYAALVALDGKKLPARTASEITSAGVAGHCPTCRETLDLFCALLGSVAGNLALILGAKGGIYIAGGIVHHIADHLEHSQFRARFEDKGRFRGYLQAIPTWLVLAKDVAFIGLQELAEQPRAG